MAKTNDRMGFTIESATPLLMHHDNIEWADAMKEWQKDPANKGKSVAGDDRTPGFTWLGYLYHDGENVAWPADNLLPALCKSAASIKFKGQQTFKTLVPSGLHLVGDYLKFLVLNDKTKQWEQIPIEPILRLNEENKFGVHVETVRKMGGFDLYVKRVAVNGSKHVRVRPIFRQWRIVGEMTITDPEIFTTQVITNIFDGLKSIGFGDWRPTSPSKPGRYGIPKGSTIKAGNIVPDA